LPKLKFLLIILILLINLSFAQTGAKYLVIAHDSYVSAIKPLVDWKTKKGIQAKCVPLSQTGNTVSEIKSFIYNAYCTWNPRPEYILLVGSPNVLPAYQDAYDDYYADIGGGTYQIELCIGRFHCATLAQCSVMVAKTIGYEKCATTNDSLWFLKGTTIVREDNPPDPYYQPDCRYVRNLWLTAGYTHIDSFLSTSGDNQDSVINAINDGRAFVVFRGQSTNYWWSPFTVNPYNTDNGYKLPIVVSGTCATISLAPGESMVGDAFLRAGTIQNPKGAVGFFGTTGSSNLVSQYRSLVTKGFFQALFQESTLPLGVAAKRAKFIMDSVLPDPLRYMEWNLLGDPELNVWTQKPKPMTVSYDSLVLFQPTTFPVQVRYQGIPVSNALVCVMMDSTVYTYGYTDGSGLVTLNFTPQHNGALQVTVTAHNYFPYEETAMVYGGSPDAGVVQIVLPSGIIDSTGPIYPRAKVKNYGSSTATLTVTFKISTVYNQSRNKTLGAMVEDTVNFPAWTPSRGLYVTRCSTYLSGDVNHNNDTLAGSFTVLVRDAGVKLIMAPSGIIDSGSVITPKAKVKNFGTIQASFPVTFRIGTFYNNTQNVNNLNPGDSTIVGFTPWAALQKGTYATKCTTSLTGDANPFNNSLISSVTVRARRTISGKVKYYSNQNPIESTKIVLSGARTDTTLTDSSGYYHFTNLFDSLVYNVTPQKKNQQRQTAVGVYDAGLILEYGVNIIPLDSLQQIAADVSGNEIISSYDAALVLQYAVGMRNHFPVGYESGSDTFDWVFRPPTRTYAPLLVNQLNQDYRAILYGDVSGNWNSQPTSPELKGLALNSVYFGNSSEKEKNETQDKPESGLFVFPIKVYDLNDVISADIILDYVAEEITIKNVTLGDSTLDYLFAWGVDKKIIKIALAGVRSLHGSVELAKVFYQINTPGIPNPIRIRSIVFNESPIINSLPNDNVEDNKRDLSSQLSLLQNQPNPFKAKTIIAYSLPMTTIAKLSIYNSSGREVKILFNGKLTAGFHYVQWDGKDNSGQILPTGIYFCRLETERIQEIKKIVKLE